MITNNINAEFADWFYEALKEKGMNLGSFCRVHNLKYNTLYCRLNNGAITDKDVVELSRLLNNYSFIKELIDTLNVQIAKIEGGEEL